MTAQPDLAAALGRARGFLREARWAPGFWLDFRASVGYSTHWVTAYIAGALADAGESAESLAAVAEWLLAEGSAEGGWGFNGTVPPDADSTGNVALLLAGGCRSRVDDAQRAACARILERFLTEDGGARTYRPLPARPDGKPPRYIHAGSQWCAAHVCVTALVAEALFELPGGHTSPAVQAAAAFIRRRQTREGCWESFWWRGRAYSTYRAARLLSKLGDRESLAAAARWARQSQREDGTWEKEPGSGGTPFDTALGAATLQLLPDPESRTAVERAIAALLRAQRDDGSWDSSAWLREPTALVNVAAPWSTPAAPYNQHPVQDHARLFTTATILSTLSPTASRLRSF